MDFKYILKSSRCREHIIEKFCGAYDNNWQTVHTPWWVCNEMCDLIPKDVGHLYIVMFAIEFVEVLRYRMGISGEDILFVCDTEGESKLAKVFYDVSTLLCSKEQTPDYIMKEVIKPELSKELYMPRTDKLVVLGNPPYQSMDGGFKASAMPIYHLFIEAIIDSLTPRYLSFIIPSRWMVSGKGLNDHRERMMNDKRMKYISHFPGEREVFPSVSIKGGVNYFLWDRDYEGMCTFEVQGTSTERYLNEYDVIIQDNNALAILKKVKNLSSKFINNTCFSSKPFGLRTFYSDWVDTGVPCYTQGKIVKYVADESYTDKNGIIGKWKVATSKATSEGNINPDKSGAMSIATNFFIIEPNAICTETYIIVNAFDTKEEAENFIIYMKTKFFRFMLGIRTITQDINTEKFAFVPDIGQYYLPTSDEKLYKMFNLTRQQQNYIESKIKELK